MTLYWHDYETWGIDTQVDRPAQFAGVRTDLELNIISDPLVLYCQPAADVLPNPEACLVTGIAPQTAIAKGLKESQFIARIHQELAHPGTCGVGYNSIPFDDEVTRNTLYRNFFDPYEREWANGNGRWDIINMVRLCYALRPDGLEWPMVEGKPSFRLELLTAANGIAHGSAHDAYSDVAATIELARLVKAKQPALYEYVFSHRRKDAVAKLIDLKTRKPLLHISAKFSSLNGCAGLVAPLAMHPDNANGVIVYNLSTDPTDLIHLPEEQLAERVFGKQADLGEGEERIPLKLVHLNKCPVLATTKLLGSAQARRLNIDLQQCAKHWQLLRDADIGEKIRRVMSYGKTAEPRDVERQLYDQFMSKQDKPVMAAVRKASAQELAEQQFVFTDKRLTELFWRYKARNFPEILTEAERAQWFEFCRGRLANGEKGIQSVQQLKEKIRSVDESQTLSKDQKIVLQQLYRYATELAKQYQVGAKCGW